MVQAAVAVQSRREAAGAETIRIPNNVVVEQIVVIEGPARPTM